MAQVSSLTRLMNRMKDPDPDKRPTLDAVLMSSYFDEVDQNYTKEDLTRLKKATVAYSKTLGKQAAELGNVINRAEGQIRQLELSKSDGLLQVKIRQAELLKAQVESRGRRLSRQLGQEWDAKKKKDLERDIDSNDKRIKGLDDKIVQMTGQLGSDKSRVDLEDIDKKIAAERDKIAAARKQLKALHDDPQYAAILKELEEANKAFA
ncbi:hypothetical protein ACFSZS_05305 [Seohaeicola zhoushanensis]